MINSLKVCRLTFSSLLHSWKNCFCAEDRSKVIYFHHPFKLIVGCVLKDLESRYNKPKKYPS